MHKFTYIFVFTLVLCFAAKLGAQTTEAVSFGPLHKALGLPLDFNLGGTHRIRYELLDSQFRAGRNGGDQILNLRTTLMATIGRAPTWSNSNCKAYAAVSTVVRGSTTI